MYGHIALADNRDPSRAISSWLDEIGGVMSMRMLTLSKNGISAGSSSLHVSRLCLLLHQAHLTLPSLGALVPHGHQN
jgi:hypothetical protein